MTESFLNDRVTLHPGDCLEVLARLEANSVDSVVTDPPYHLTSIVKRFGAENAAPAKVGKTGAYARASSGFMGKQWDGGDIAFRIETWQAILRVLKPGGHLLAFSGTRTYHRMAVAIDDAGFEIRDMISWLYGSGFPKSHDVSKGIDRANGDDRPVLGRAKGAASSDTESLGEFQPEYDLTSAASAASAAWQGWGTALKPACEPICLARKPLSEGTVAANVLRWGCGALNIDACRVGVSSQPRSPVRGDDHDSREDSRLCTCPSPTDDQTSRTQNNGSLPSSASPRQQQSDRSSNAERSGRDDQQSQGSLNDCRPSDDSCGEHTRQYEGHARAPFEPEDDAQKSHVPDDGRQRNRAGLSKPCPIHTTPDIQQQGKRWPANVIHDGSEEVVGAFPETVSGSGLRGGKLNSFMAGRESVRDDDAREFNGDSGTAARFFYQVKPDDRKQADLDAVKDMATWPEEIRERHGVCPASRLFYTSKADADDRLGSKHPTVKPLDLMQWLVRLVTPPGGTVLDPFAGTGTTGEAAWREGMCAVLIERETEYQADIRRRMAHALAGPQERKHTIAKVKHGSQPFTDGLFATVGDRT